MLAAWVMQVAKGARANGLDSHMAVRLPAITKLVLPHQPTMALISIRCTAACTARCIALCSLATQHSSLEAMHATLPLRDLLMCLKFQHVAC